MELKLCHRETTFRVPVDFAGLNFTSLKKKVLYKFPLLDWSSIQLYWRDSDGDDILLQDDDDVKVLKRSCSNNVLKVTVKDVDSKHRKSVKAEFVKQEKIGSFIDSKNSSYTMQHYHISIRQKLNVIFTKPNCNKTLPEDIKYNCTVCEGENVKTNIDVDLQTSTNAGAHFVNREKRNSCDLIKENKPTSSGKSAPVTSGDKSKKKFFWKPIVDKPAPPTLSNVNANHFNSNTNTRKFIFRKTSCHKNAEFAETKISQSSSVVNNNSPRQKSHSKKRKNIKTNSVDLETSTRAGPHFVNREKRKSCDLTKENKPTSAGKSAPETNGDKSKKKVFWKPIVDKPPPPTLNNVNADRFNSNMNTRKIVFRKTSSHKNVELAEMKISQSSSSVVNNNSPRRKSLRNKKPKSSAELHNVANRFGSAEDDFREQQPIGAKKWSRKRVNCKLCSAVVRQDTLYVRSHLKAAHLNNTSIDWLYQCVTCGMRNMALVGMQYHVRRCCGKSNCVKDAEYFENKEAIGELAKIRRLAFPLFPTRSENGSTTVKCSVCGKVVIRYGRKSHAVIHTEIATGNQWLYECLLCGSFTSVYRTNVVRHVKNVHGKDLCRKGVEYNEIDSIKKIIESAISFAFPDKS